jgi:hypothetical protein
MQLIEPGLLVGQRSELGRAHEREVRGVEEQHEPPAVPLAQLDPHEVVCIERLKRDVRNLFTNAGHEALLLSMLAAGYPAAQAAGLGWGWVESMLDCAVQHARGRSTTSH